MRQDSASALPCALEVSNLSVILGGLRVLEIPSLQVRPNEVLVVIGPNGSGKTTLLLSLAMLVRPASGIISYQGQPISINSDILALRRRLAVVFQEPLLLSATVRDNVILGLRLRECPREDIKARTQKWLERFGIAHLAQRQANALSGGEAKRTSLARAFALQPEVLFLDEPFNGLDSPTRQALMEDFESVLRETNITTVMVTHDLNEALVLAHRVIVLINGHIRQIGTPEEVFSYPVDKEVANFAGVENIIKGVISSTKDRAVTIDIGGNFIEAISDYPAGEDVFACVRPEDVTLAISKVSSSARNSFAGEITRAVSLGPLSRIEIDCGFPLVALVTRRSAEELALVKGQHIYAAFKATGVHVVKRHS